MRKFKFTKLVRDKIVQAVIDGGNIPNWRTLSKDEYITELKKKISEEAQEIPSADSNKLVQELADLQEVIDNLLEALNISKQELLEAQRKKNKSAGSFKKRHYIEEVKVAEDSEWSKYYLEKLEKYPEIT